MRLGRKDDAVHYQEHRKEDTGLPDDVSVSDKMKEDDDSDELNTNLYIYSGGAMVWDIQLYGLSSG